MTITQGNKGGSWSGGHSNPTPTKSSQPIVDNIIKAQKENKFTNFTFEDWSISFMESEPFAWYITHKCFETESQACVDKNGLIAWFSAIFRLGCEEKMPQSSTACDQDNRTIHYLDKQSRYTGVDDKVKEEGFPGAKELETEIKCYKCKTALPKYSYLILRRTQKFLLIGKLPFQGRGS